MFKYLKLLIKYNTKCNELKALEKEVKDNLYVRTKEMYALKINNNGLKETNKKLRKKIKELKNKER